MTPPSLDAPAAGEMWDLLKTGRRFRALGRTDAFRLLRWGPMAVADLVAEWFETDLLQAAVAARGIFGTAQGPWSAGTGAVLLLNAAADPAPGGSSVDGQGRAGRADGAMAEAAREAGAEIRTGAGVTRILVRDGRAAGVVLEDGREIPAGAVVSNADPRRTFLELVDPDRTRAGLPHEGIRNYRCRGTVAKVNFALGALPAFAGVSNPADLPGRSPDRPGIDYLERAFDASKYGEISAEPYLDIAIPSLRRSVAGAAGRHVMSVYMQFAPYKLANGVLGRRRDELGDRAATRSTNYAPGIGQPGRASAGDHARAISRRPTG